MAMKQCIYNIGVEATLDVIGGKWKPVILCHLKSKTMRMGELRRAIPNITQKVLTQQLRDLEDNGVVERHAYQQVPPKVEYSLSEHGESLRGLLDELCHWGEEDIKRRGCNGESVLLLDDDSELSSKQAN